MGKALSPLNWQVPIVHPSGTPTSEFQRAWAQLQDASGAIQPIQTTQEMSDLLDLIGATPGSLLHRGPSGWQIITGANGDLLKRGAAGWQVLPSPNDNTKFLAGDLTWQSAGGGNIQTMLDTISTTQGVVLYRSGSAWMALSPGSNGQYLQTQGPANNPQWATLPTVQQLLDGITTTRGSIMYRGASGWSALTPGTSGNVLQTQGTGADPLWAAPGSANIQTLLDGISNVRGTILYRGASAWAALAPGASGNVLTSGGAGADPAWGAGGGGGGGAMIAPSNIFTSASVTSNASATKGMALLLAESCNIVDIRMPVSGMAIGNQMTGRILAMSTATTIGSVVASTPAVALTAASQTVVLPFSSPVALTPGRYALVVSWSNAPSDSSVLACYTGGSYYPNFPNMPVGYDNVFTGILYIAKRVPAASDVMTAASSNYYYLATKFTL